MLWKLLKHEFKAMGRIMLPVWAALLLLSTFVHLADRLFLRGDSMFAELFTAMLIMLFATSCVAAAVVAVIMMVLRFQKTMLSREGYLTHTLPVNVHQLVWSRMLTALAYIVLTSLVIAISFFISIAQTGVVKEMLNVFTALWQDLMGYSVLHGVLYVVEFVLLVLAAGLSSCLMFYAALSIGHSFANHKMLLSVVFYFALYTASQIVSLIGMEIGRAHV